MKTVTLTEANQQFSALIREAERRGTAFAITRRGRVVAELRPAVAAAGRRRRPRSAAERRIVRLMRKGLRLGGLRIGDRGALYDRD